MLSLSGQLDISRMFYRVEHKIKFISLSEYIIFCLLYKHQLNTKSAFGYVTITTVISSRGKITCYLHVRRCEVLAGKFTWYFTGVYITKKLSQGTKTYP